jgi:hypothetical protein
MTEKRTMMASTQHSSGTSSRVFTALFWVTIVLALTGGLGLLFIDKVLPGIGVLFGGALLALIFAGFAGGLLPDGKAVPRPQLIRNMRGILMASVIMTACGILLRIVHPGFLADLLALWSGPQMIIASVIILVVLRRSSSKP